MVEINIERKFSGDEAVLEALICKAVEDKELELKQVSIKDATRALFYAFKNAQFVSLTEGGYKVSRADLITLTKEQIGDDAFSLVNWFQRNNAYEDGYIVFAISKVKKTEEEKKEEDRISLIGSIEISATLIRGLEENIKKGATTHQINFIYDLIAEQTGDYKEILYKKITTSVSRMVTAVARKLQESSRRNPEGLIDKETLVSEIAEELMLTHTREILNEVKKIYTEIPDREKANKEIEARNLFDKLIQAKIEHLQKEEEVNEVFKFLINRGMLKEIEDTKGKKKIIIWDKKLRDTFNFSSDFDVQSIYEASKEAQMLSKKEEEKEKELKKGPDKTKKSTTGKYFFIAVIITVIAIILYLMPYLKKFINPK